MSKLRTLLGFNMKQQVLILPVFLLTGLARLSVLVFPFRRLHPLLGQHLGNTALCLLLTDKQEQQARETGELVRAVSHNTPWQSNCLVQALVSHALLKWHRIPHVINLGVQTRDGKMQAHAWCCAGRIFVTGGDSYDCFSIVSCYLSGTELAPSNSPSPMPPDKLEKSFQFPT